MTGWHWPEMEKAAVLADSRLFLPVSPRDACVQEQAVQLLPTTQQQPTKNKQLPDNNYELQLQLQLQLRTATSTANFYFDCKLQPQLPTTNYQLPTTNYQLPTTNYQLPTTNFTTHIYCKYCNPLVLLVFTTRTSTSTSTAITTTTTATATATATITIQHQKKRGA
ncbi:hypothetical protein PQR34_42675 [Paraburkholderia sediminicola]|uniref:hypothetical protein n=1 Tax=Paraburkholderia sediminicola TaxID=458836 RepID=UPI0038BCC32D